MKELPHLQPITDPVAELSKDSHRLIVLTTKRRVAGFLTGAEALEIDDIIRRHDERRRLADLAHDQATEAHAFKTNSNPHDD